jgi:hypothetical protein
VDYFGTKTGCLCSTAQLHQTTWIPARDVIRIGGTERPQLSVEHGTRHLAMGQIVDSGCAATAGRIFVALKFQPWNLLEQSAGRSVDPLSVHEMTGVVVTYPRFQSRFGCADSDIVEKFRYIANTICNRRPFPRQPFLELS